MSPAARRAQNRNQPCSTSVRLMLKKVVEQPGCMAHERYHLLVRHSRRTDDTDNAREASHVVFRGDDRELLEPWVGVFGTNGDRYTRSRATPNRLRELLGPLGESKQAAEPVRRGELRLLRKHRR